MNIENKIRSIIEKLDNEIVELENENTKIIMYRGAVNIEECGYLDNPLFLTKGLFLIIPKDNKFEVKNNTSDTFESMSKVNEENGFRNLAKELYSKGYRIDEVYYNEYSEFPGYESIEIFDSEYYDANEKLNSHIFDNNKILNRELLHVGYKNNYDKDDITDWDYHSYRNWFHIFEDFTNGEFLVIEIIDKENIVYNKKIIYDPQCFNENIEELITKYKLY